MAKVRVSQHSGRSGSARHNDRSFMADWSAEKRKEFAPHIREDASGDNRVWACVKKPTIEEAEIAFYEMRYARSIEATNERYREQRHAERCRTVEDVYRDKRTRPEEMILQIGNKDSNIDPDEFQGAVVAYMQRLRDWNEEHGNHMHLLSVAIHVDESSPHAHVRRVWDYEDKDGLTRLGQERALEEAGVQLPDPSRAKGRYNNRKMEFDRMARSMWQEVCIEHGFEVEREPRPQRVRHKDTNEYAADREAERLARELEERQKELEATHAAIERDNAILGHFRASEHVIKRKMGGREVVELDRETFETLQRAAGQVDKAQEIIGEAKDIVGRAKSEAEEIVKGAQDEQDWLTEHSASAQINQIRRDWPEVDKCFSKGAWGRDDVYQGKDYPERQARKRERERDHGRGR